ncbi:hypothetical protein [Glutamicibacter sp. HZAU]|uniref:hypothetical protein n=1 Tax=Glutamicibacter sp. HZAU TaxID=2049891 RepID=UPI000FFB5CE0|nr:hypothetical protein [Glutamicibacter sp. HZAU]RWZ79853.1 hypothetical protein EKH49_15270 [Glutamicibacter sp. HZAU]
MAGFVIQYHRFSGDRIVKEFDGPEGSREALLERLKLETERPNSDWEIVSLNSDSLETIKKTHSRYFSGHTVSSMAV